MNGQVRHCYKANPWTIPAEMAARRVRHANALEAKVATRRK